MSQPSSRLSFTKYSAHPTFSDSLPSALVRVSVKQLRALVWYHASTAGAATRQVRVVDPRKWKRPRLLEHANTVLKGHMRRVAGPDMDVILAQYHRETADEAVVQALLASVTQPPEAAVRGGRRLRHRVGCVGLDDDDDRVEGEAEGVDPAEPGSDEGGEGEASGEEGEGGEAGGEEDEKAATGLGDEGDDDVGESDSAPRPPPPRKGQGWPAGTTQRVATAMRSGATTAATSTTRTYAATPPPPSTGTGTTVLAHCISCSAVNDMTIRAPSFCFACGHPWGVPPNGARQRRLDTATGSETSTASAPTPTTWAGATAFRPKPTSSLVPAPHSRAPGLAPLDEKIIKHAREGQQHYNLTDLLQLRAEDRSAMSSAALSESAIQLDPIEGKLIAAVEAAATSARSAAARRRTISSFTDIAEAITFSLIGTIYVDRPDIGEQLLALLIIAQDLTRAWGWTLALDYVERVRVKFYESEGGPRGRHCLLIDSHYDMGKSDIEILLHIQMNHQLPPGRENSDPNRGGAVAAGIKQREKSGAICKGWNAGTCSRKAADCKYLHRCSTCNAADHPAARCTKTHRVGPRVPRQHPQARTRAEPDSPWNRISPSNGWRRVSWADGSSRAEGIFLHSARKLSTLRPRHPHNRPPPSPPRKMPSLSTTPTLG